MDIPQDNSIISPQTFPYMVAAFASLVGLALIINILRGNYGVPDGDAPGDPFTPLNLRTMVIVSTAIAHMSFCSRLQAISWQRLPASGVWHMVLALASP